MFRITRNVYRAFKGVNNNYILPNGAVNNYYRCISNTNKCLFTLKSKQTENIKENSSLTSDNHNIDTSLIEGLIDKDILNFTEDSEINESKTTEKEEKINDLGLANFLKKTFLIAGAGIGNTLVTSELLCAYDFAEISMVPGCIISAISIAAIISIKCTYVRGKYGVEVNPNPIRYGSFVGLSFGTGCVLAPVIQICNEIDPTILPISCLLSLATMGSAAGFVYNFPDNSKLILKTPIIAALGGLCSVSLTSLVCGILFGFDSPFALLLQNIDTYGGILLFSLLVGYDTQKAIERYKRKQPDQIGCAVELYLDFINLLVRVVASKNNKK